MTVHLNRTSHVRYELPVHANRTRRSLIIYEPQFPSFVSPVCPGVKAWSINYVLRWNAIRLDGAFPRNHPHVSIWTARNPKVQLRDLTSVKEACDGN